MPNTNPRRAPWDALEAILGPLRGRSMHDPGCELPRILLLRGWANRVRPELRRSVRTDPLRDRPRSGHRGWRLCAAAARPPARSPSPCRIPAPRCADTPCPRSGRGRAKRPPIGKRSTPTPPRRLPPTFAEFSFYEVG